MPVTIDPRHHDAAVFDLHARTPETAAAATLIGRLHDAGIRTAVVPSHRGGADAPAGVIDRAEKPDQARLVEAADRLGARPGRCVVVTDGEAGVAAARAGGFALVIGLDRTGQADPLRRRGADDVVTDLGEVSVRTGDPRMSELPDGMRVVDLVRDAGVPPAVFFDFDGTLSEIVNDPAAARLTAGAAEALQLLAARCPVAVLSGRDLADVCRRVGLAGIWYAGSHGFELTAPDGTHHHNEAAAPSIAVLGQVALRLRDQLAAIPGVVVEHKRFAVAVHYRSAPRDRVGEVAAAVRAAGRREALRVTTGREVIELRPNIDWDKGKTLNWVIDHLHGAGTGPLLPIYLGDDLTDEDAFDAVRQDGIGIVVRHTDDGDRATAARFALDGPAQVSEFARRLAGQLPVSQPASADS
ncbi:trehalose-phosphatase [Mycobacterium botniense]|uniref:Trehalose 6-phosphate phosphatase n=1 Tax=Mycobacterium botniense TaxID=84962 RepID=A0A7I9XSN4_9MYCO|nr:trehalose-phosphatase [Mycobacterium botniense]GFG73009.1 trehalose-phosphate phosphatase [Mycobacterium botniense]